MKKISFSFKSLLVAAGLLIGSANAWADGSKRTLSAQDYETAGSPDWVTNNDKVTISLESGDATYGKYVKVDMGNNTANRGAYKTITPNYEYGTGYTTAGMTMNGYNVEFDMLIQSGNTQDRSVSQFAVTTVSYTTTSGTLYSGDYIFALSQPTRNASGVDTKWYVNNLELDDEEKAVTLSNSKWYHVKLVVTASSVYYTIIDNSTESTVKSGSKTVESLPSLNEFFTVVGRGYGKTQFDNMEIYDYVAEITVNAPTFSFKKVDGEKRIYTLSNPNGSGTLYYTTTPAAEEPAKGGAAYSSTASTSLDVEYDETGTYYAYVLHSGGSVTSPITSQAVEAGAINLNAPVFKVEDMVLAEDGNYYPKVSFSSDNSGITGSPTATLNTASPYTFTATGSITVTASADGYTSSSNTFTVGYAYGKSNTIDFGAMEASDFDAAWITATGVPRDYWTNRAASIPADVPYYKVSDTSADNSAILDGITIKNSNERVPEVYIGYGLLTPYTAVSGSGNNMNFTVNGATSEDYVVYNGWNNYGSGTFNTVLAGNATFGLYRYDTMLRTINVYSPAAESVTVSTASYATYVSSYNLDYTDTDIKAYTAAINESTGVITLTKINKVPANTPVLLYKDGGATENIPVTASVDAVGTNNLVKGTGAAVATGTGPYNYILNKIGGVVGFYKANDKNVATNRAYLQTSYNVADGGGVKALKIIFADENATGIAAPEVEYAEEDGVLYNTAGQVVSKDYKGIVIKNGKKIINK